MTDTIGARIKRARKRKKLTLNAASEKIGVCNKTLRNWEENNYPISFLQLYQFLRLTDTTFEDLIKQSDVENSCYRCRFACRAPYEKPCSVCARNHTDYFEKKLEEVG